MTSVAPFTNYAIPSEYILSYHIIGANKINNKSLSLICKCKNKILGLSNVPTYEIIVPNGTLSLTGTKDN